MGQNPAEQAAVDLEAVRQIFALFPTGGQCKDRHTARGHFCWRGVWQDEGCTVKGPFVLLTLKLFLGPLIIVYSLSQSQVTIVFVFVLKI